MQLPIRTFEELKSQIKILNRNSYFEPSVKGFLRTLLTSFQSGAITKEQKDELMLNLTYFKEE